MFKRILIANRGEIATRIARTCRRVGIDYVGVYSDADREALHLDGAVERVAIGPAPAAQSYLNGEAIIRAALLTGCEAVHPGYGFLSENAAFATAVEAAGVVFIGPTPETIAAMGDKSTAKNIMVRAGVPVVPGSTEATDDPESVATLLDEIGRPALLKPVAGGGGKGMAVIDGDGSGRDAIESSIRTARASFGDGRLLVERFVRNPRHIEVQIFGDGRGEVVHLFERECSLQRRHQKIVEEAPAATLSESLRAELIEAALRGARAIRYRNAGTFEFIVGNDGSYYFLEVNTRLQVEHPVTEAVTGIDLVEWQLRIAAGEGLPLSQAQIRGSGHAIECRLYAEDPAAGFRPAPGQVGKVIWPAHARVETALGENSTVPPDYDPMIAKLVVHAEDRSAAIDAMSSALNDTAVIGLTTNLAFLRQVIAAPEVAAGSADTGFVDAAMPRLIPKSSIGDALAAAAAAIACMERGRSSVALSPWMIARPCDRAMLDPDAPLGRIVLSLGEMRYVVRIRTLERGGAIVEVEDDEQGPSARAVSIQRHKGLISGTVGGQSWHALVRPDVVDVVLAGTSFRIGRMAIADDAAAAGAAAATAPMPGVVVALSAVVGQRISRGHVLAVIEAMKFENPVAASRDGVVAEVTCAVGEQVQAGQVLVRLEDETDDAAADNAAGGD